MISVIRPKRERSGSGAAISEGFSPETFRKTSQEAIWYRNAARNTAP